MPTGIPMQAYETSSNRVQLTVLTQHHLVDRAFGGVTPMRQRLGLQFRTT